MGTTAGSDGAVRAMALLLRFALDLRRAAQLAMGPALTASLDIRLMWLVHEGGGLSSSALVDELALPRSTVARSLSRVREAGLVERDSDPQDARRAQWRLTRTGRQRVAQYVAATADTFRRHRTPVEHLLLLHARVPGSRDGGGSAAAVLGAADSVRSAQAALDRAIARDHAAVDLGATVDRAGLLTVAERGSSRPGELSEATGLSPAGVTSLVDRLVGHDLVVRERGLGGDGRAVVITLTASGQRAVEALVRAFRQHQDRLLDALAMTLTVGDPATGAGSTSALRDDRSLLR